MNTKPIGDKCTMARGCLYATLGALLLLLIPSSVQAHPSSPHILCDDRGLIGSVAFCPAIYQAHQRLKDNDWTKWWADWAEEHEVLVEQHEFTGAWPYRNTVAFSDATGSVRDSIILVHEYQHLMDDYGLPPGITCSVMPWSHERVIFWEELAAIALEDREYFWQLFTLQTGYELQARFISYGLTEPCRAFGAVEIAPHGITYSQLRVALNWW